MSKNKDISKANPTSNAAGKASKAVNTKEKEEVKKADTKKAEEKSTPVKAKPIAKSESKDTSISATKSKSTAKAKTQSAPAKGNNAATSISKSAATDKKDTAKPASPSDNSKQTAGEADKADKKADNVTSLKTKQNNESQKNSVTAANGSPKNNNDKSDKKKRAHIIVIGNEKGGTGKSTISFHLIISLLQSGYKVASIDLDGRQGTLTRHVQNRIAFSESSGIDLLVPNHLQVTPMNYSDHDTCKDDVERLSNELEKLVYEHDVIVIDTPGTNNHLFRTGHSYADTLITPINDSLIDFDILAKVDPQTMGIVSPSKYAEFVWEVRKNRAASGAGQMEWIVIRNRLTHLDAKNKRQVKKLIGDLAKRIGCRAVPGFGERMIYRELFLKGLTVLDIGKEDIDVKMSVSHVSARQELRTLIEAIKLDKKVSEHKEQQSKGTNTTNEAKCA